MSYRSHPLNSFWSNSTTTGLKGQVTPTLKEHLIKGNLKCYSSASTVTTGTALWKGVLIHYQKKHRDVKANADLVRRHTAVVRSQRERAQMVQAGSSTSTASVATEAEKSRSLRSLKCRHCAYTSPYVYALKKHLKKDHPTVKATAMTILHWAYQDGVLEAGYHCEWCIYSHAEPSGLLMHYQRRHPEHNVDYTYMASKLWAGPDTSTSRQAGTLKQSITNAEIVPLRRAPSGTLLTITKRCTLGPSKVTSLSCSTLSREIKHLISCSSQLPKGHVSMSSPFQQ